MTTRDEIRAWFEAGRERGATHMLVVADLFDYGNFPVYVLPGENIFLRADDNRTSSPEMRELMEVYSYALPFEAQLGERRSHHFDVAEASASPLELTSDELKKFAARAGTLERLLTIRGPDLDNPHWRQALQTCLDDLNKLLVPAKSESEGWYFVEGVRYCSRCRTRRCTRQTAGWIPCLPQEQQGRP